MPTEEAQLLRDEKLKNYLAGMMREGETRMSKIEDSVDDVKQDLAEIRRDMSSVLEVLNTAKAGLKLIGYLGFIVKWTSGVTIAAVAVYAVVEKLWK